MTAIAESKDEEITTDDLQAMKAMIGDIKKDPSLLFRLTSLSIDANTLTASNACNRGNTASAGNNGEVFIVDDDTNTVVSALTMPSVGDWTTGGYPQHHLPHHHHGAGVAGEGGRSHNIMERHPSSSPTFRMGRGQYQSSSTFAQATATAVTRTNNDAEIALRMQSLRAQRSGTNGRRTVQSNSPQVTSNRIQQSTTTPLKILPSSSDKGRLLARTPSPTGGTRSKTNSSPGGIGTSTPTSSKRHQVSSSSFPDSTSRPLIMAADSVNEGNVSDDKKPHGSRSRQRSRRKDTTDNIESENSHQAGALVLYERNDGCNDIDGGLKPEAPSSQVIMARSNRHGKQSTQLTSVPSNSLTQYHPLTPSPKSNKVGKDSTQRSVNAKNVQQPPFHESERSIIQPSPSLSTSRRTSSRQTSDRRRGAKKYIIINFNGSHCIIFVFIAIINGIICIA